ncbi:hypothetical protein OC846_001686 [Tilletia horrida]|uniref:Vacuolar import and degradation protein n=1 Tax=Tilletia horrida TaxID=155126 RepID=A0AAN6GSC8_9BASI|nr:hypothetical protein OC846_001686 [Tilletia horrida]
MAPGPSMASPPTATSSASPSPSIKCCPTCNMPLPAITTDSSSSSSTPDTQLPSTHDSATVDRLLPDDADQETGSQCQSCQDTLQASPADIAHQAGPSISTLTADPQNDSGHLFNVHTCAATSEPSPSLSPPYSSSGDAVADSSMSINIVGDPHSGSAVAAGTEPHTLPLSPPASVRAVPLVNLPSSTTACSADTVLDNDAPTAMSIDQQPDQPAPDPTPNFGPHLMTRPRISIATQAPLERVVSQHPIEFSVSAGAASLAAYHLSSRLANSSDTHDSLTFGKHTGGSTPNSGTHLMSALSRPYKMCNFDADQQMREQVHTESSHAAFFDPGRPDPLRDSTYLRRYPTSRGCLHAGARFEGTQTSDRSSYDVTVIFTHVDLEASQLCGTINIRGLTEDWPELITFFDAEIIGSKHSFLTGKWGASETQDAKHWGRFAPFRPLRKYLDRPDLRFDHNNKPFVFMRWKERFLVPDHRVKNVTGASYDGFYYVCLALDPEGADPVIPLPAQEATGSSRVGGMQSTYRYPTASNRTNAPRATVPQLADVIMNSATGRIPADYNPSWNPSPSYLSSMMASIRRFDAAARGASGTTATTGAAPNATPIAPVSTTDGAANEASYVASGPTVSTPVVGTDELGIGGFGRNLALANSLEQARNSLSATAAALVPTLPQPRNSTQTNGASTPNYPTSLRHLMTDPAQFRRPSESQATASRTAAATTNSASIQHRTTATTVPTGRTFTSRTMSENGAWVEVTEMEVEAETENEAEEDRTLPSSTTDAPPTEAVCDVPVQSAPLISQRSEARSAGPNQSVAVDVVPTPAASNGTLRANSRGLLDATVAQASNRRMQSSSLNEAEEASERTTQLSAEKKRTGAEFRPRVKEPVVGRCVGYYFSEQSEPFQQISLRYVPERPMGSFELR